MNKWKGLLVAIIIFECLLRIVLPNILELQIIFGDNGPGEPCAALRPNASVQYKGMLLSGIDVLHSVNSQGFRGPTAATLPTEGVTRIAVIGDSYTYGQGVEQNQSMPHYLQTALENKKGFGNVEVLNFGVPRFSLGDEADYLRTFVSRFHPDAVIWLVTFNDLEPYACEWPLDNLYPEDRKMNISRLPYLVVFVSAMFQTISNINEVPELETLIDRANYSFSLALKNQQVHLDNVPLFIAILTNPMPKQHHQSFWDILDNSTHTFRDYEALFQNQPTLFMDGHLTAEGNRAMSDSISQWVGDELENRVNHSGARIDLYEHQKPGQE